MAAVAFLIYQGLVASANIDGVLEALVKVSIFILAAWLLTVALIMMRASTGASPRRLALMALYLPLHWAMMVVT
jgi:hypothetical protein